MFLDTRVIIVLGFLYTAFAVMAIWLSISCYSPEDETPIGMKILLAIIAGGWNILYLIYYMFTAYVIGWQCPSK